MARDAGAKNVYFASAAPPVRFPNVYGIDMPSRDELVAFNKDDEQIRNEIGADALLYQDLNELKKNIIEEGKLFDDFDCSCFDGRYVTDDIDEAYLNRIEMLRSDKSLKEPSKSSSQLDLILDPSGEEEHA